MQRVCTHKEKEVTAVDDNASPISITECKLFLLKGFQRI